MTYNIEKNVPIPEGAGKPKSEIPTTLSKMEPGDSVLFHDVSPNNLRARIHDFKRRYKNQNWNFVIRQEGEGSRCWRTEDRSTE